MRMFTVLTRKSVNTSVRRDSNNDCKTLTDAGWAMRTNALLGTNYIGSTSNPSNVLIYLPAEDYEHEEHNINAVHPPTQQIIDWATEVLIKAGLRNSPTNRSIVYSIYGYNNTKAKVQFILCTDDKIANIAKKLAPEIPILFSPIDAKQLKEMVIKNE